MIHVCKLFNLATMFNEIIFGIQIILKSIAGETYFNLSIAVAA